MGWGSLIIIIMRFIYFQAEDDIQDVERSRGLGVVYKRLIMFNTDQNRAILSDTGQYRAIQTNTCKYLSILINTEQYCQILINTGQY